MRLIALLLFLFCFVLNSKAQEKSEEKSWSHASDLALVITEGNTETRSLSLDHQSKYDRDTHHFKFSFEHFEAEHVETTRFAVRQGEVLEIVETRKTVQTDDSFAASMHYEKDLNEKSLWDALLNWDRNEFKGIRDRYEASLGLGYRFFTSERRTIKGNAGVLLTSREQINEPADFDSEFLGYRLGFHFSQKLGTNANFEQEFSGNGSLADTSDYRLSLKNTLSSTLTKRIALKLNLKFAYENTPALRQIPIRMDGRTIGTLTEALDSLDTMFNAAVSITY